MEYKIFRHRMRGAFEALISEKLKEGWRLQGGCFSGDGDYCQAMVSPVVAAPPGEIKLREPETHKPVGRLKT